MAAVFARRTRIGLVSIALVAVSAAIPAARTRAVGGWGPDTTFGEDHTGIETTAIRGHETAQSMAVYGGSGGNAGKIVVVGSVPDAVSGNQGRSDILMVRYNPDGTLDGSFGGSTGGYVITADDQFHADRQAHAVAIQHDGRIVVVGSLEAWDSTAGSLGYRFLVSRYNANGTLDGTFGAGGSGQAAFSFPNSDPACGTNGHGACSGPAVGTAVTIQSDGKIVAAGYTNFQTPEHDEIAVLRLMPNGSLDASFNGGRVATDAPESTCTGTPPNVNVARATAVAVQPNSGRILVAGRGTSYCSGFTDTEAAVFAYTSNGVLDGAFEDGGKDFVAVPDNHDASSIAVYPSDSDHADEFLIAGSIGNSASGFYAARLTSLGKLDASFGNGGVLEDSFPNGAGATQVLLTHDGKIVLVGGIRLQQGPFQFGLLRLTPDGQFDQTFTGNAALITTPIGSGDAYAFTGALDPSGRILAAGSTAVSGGTNIAVARYTGPGAGLLAQVEDLDTWQTHPSYPVKWSATGAGGQVTFDVREREAKWYQSRFGAWTLVKKNTIHTQGTDTADPGLTVCYEARAHDGGNVSPWSAEQCTATPVDDPTLEQKSDVDWTTKRATACYRGTYTYSVTQPGGYLYALLAVVKQLSVVIAEGPGYGTIEVLLDGKVAKTIHEASSSKKCGVVVDVPVAKPGKHNIEIKHVNSKAPAVVDGLGVSLK